MSVKFKTKEILFEEGGMSFLKLGEFANKDNIGLSKFKLSKIQKIDEIWGTLGFGKDTPMKVKGNLICSKGGNIDHKGITGNITETLKNMNIELNGSSEIVERFIDLSDVEFLNLADSIRSIEDLQLRLELFLEKTEGALVYVQFNPKKDYNPEDCHIQLITPQATPGNKQDRLSLTYFIDYTFGKIPTIIDGKIDLSEKDKESNPVIKILTFKRTISDLPNVISSANIKLKSTLVDVVQDGIHLYGTNKYDLLIYNPDGSGSIDSIKKDDVATKIDTKKKTLLLIHGTFSTTHKSFQELLDPRMNGNSKSFLKHLLDEGIYEQVVAFDHPTASHSPQQNVDYLFGYLEGLVFDIPVDIITTSRGALVEHCLVADERMYRIMDVNKVMNFSPAHGSDILKAIKGIDHLLSILQKTASKSGWGFVFLLAQFSVEVIRTQSGLQAMFPDSPELEKIMNLNPKSKVKYRPMICDAHRKLFKNAKKLFLLPVDGLLKIIFMDENDWVIGCSEQRKQLKGTNAKYLDSFKYYGIHGKQFVKDYPLDLNYKSFEMFSVMFEFLKK